MKGMWLQLAMAAVLATPVWSMLVTSRSVAHNVLLRCFTDGSFADRTLATTLARESLSAADARHTTELVYGVLRHARHLDFVLSRFASLERSDAPTTVALRIGAYELLHMRTADHAAVHEAVNLSKGKGQQGFVNAVLRRLARERSKLPTPEESFESAEEALAVST